MTTPQVADTGSQSQAAPSPLAPRPPVHSWDEFTTLREIIVGDATHAYIPAMTDISAWLNCYPTLTAAELAKIEKGSIPSRVIEEANEDLAELVSALQGLGITVHRPAPPDHGIEFSSPDWRTAGFSSYCPRDLTLVIGSTIIETPSPMRARYFELFGLRPLLQEYFLNGANWLAAPRPRLPDDLFPLTPLGLPDLSESEPVFDAANVLRLGRDIFYQVSRSGNELGLRWLKSTVRLLGDIRVHPLRDVYGYTHIDSTITLLRPGLVLLNPSRITPETIPEPLHGWDVVWCPPLRPQPGVSGHTLSEVWVGMNLLMTDPEHAIVGRDQPELITALENHGIEVLPLQLRHAQVLGGGFHCVTLDIARDGGLENYLG
jgi:glycine amidinotransferase